MSKIQIPSIKRGEAADIIDTIREIVASPNMDPAEALRAVRRRLEDARIPPLTVCEGAAHSNPYIDNCGSCMPRWGLRGAKVRVS